MRELKRIVGMALVLAMIVCSAQVVLAADSEIDTDSKLGEDVSQMTPAEKEQYYDSLLLDENGEELDPEEFATSEQFEAYYDRKNISPESIQGSTRGYNNEALGLPTETVNQNNTHYKLHVGIFNQNDIYINKRVIQDIHVRNNDIYVTQNDGKGDVLIRHYIKGIYCQEPVNEYDKYGQQVSQYTTKMSDALEMQDYMIIKSAGHGTTLAAYTSPNDGNVYFLVCAGQPKTKNNKTNKIGRIQYQANTVYNNTDVQRMYNTNYATFNQLLPADYTSESLISVVANISRDEKYVYLRVKWKKGDSENILHTAYDLKKFDAVLASTSSTNNLGNFKTDTNIKEACVYSFDQYVSPVPSTDASAGRRSPFSFNTAPTVLHKLLRHSQGVAITPAGMIYNYGGHEVLDQHGNFDNEKGRYPTITRLKPTNKTVSGYMLEFNLPNSWFLDDNNQLRDPTFENEGIQMVTGHIYVGVSPQDGHQNGTNCWVAYIFDIPNSGLSF